MSRSPNLCVSRLPRAENTAQDSASKRPVVPDSSGNGPFLQARPCNIVPNLSRDPLTYPAVSSECRFETAVLPVAAVTLTFRSGSQTRSPAVRS